MSRASADEGFTFDELACPHEVQSRLALPHDVAERIVGQHVAGEVGRLAVLAAAARLS